MRNLVIVNDAPYGNERSYNGLRLALALAKREDVEIRLFLIGDAVGCAITNQQVPDGYYNLGRTVKAIAQRSGFKAGCCGTCLDARGIPDDLLVDGAVRSSLDELAEWTLWADKVIVF